MLVQTTRWAAFACLALYCVGCDEVTDPLGQERRTEAPYDAVRLRAPVGLAFGLEGALPADGLQVMCADGPEAAVHTRLAGDELVIEAADADVTSCVVTVSTARALDLEVDTEVPLELTTQQVVRLGEVSGNSVLLHASSVGSLLLDRLTVGRTLERRSTDHRRGRRDREIASSCAPTAAPAWRGRRRRSGHRLDAWEPRHRVAAGHADCMPASTRAAPRSSTSPRCAPMPPTWIWRGR
ncbi:MAG: hypothetical protein R3F59_33720 [Myxococcota bacterium]